jgi:hypothetical protein
LETIFWVKMPTFFYTDADPGSGNLLSLDPGWKCFESRLNIPDPQHGL